MKPELLKSVFKPLAMMVAANLLVRVAAMDIDSGKDSLELAKATDSWALADGNTELKGWVRLRGVDLAKASETRAALARLRERGFKSCVMLRWPAKEWKKVYLPKDLREAYENGRKLGATYGDLVDAWEVDNEPDLGYVPESADAYTAFLKANYLGLKAGMASGTEKTEGSIHSGFLHAPLVLMGSLGLPPGPWLERFAANDGFSYTDGFNYHYYGYADDFSGVYRQHEAAVKELTSRFPGFNPQSSPHVIRKHLPVILTEIGYGMLDKLTRNNKDGRLRQWRWFKSIGAQSQHLRIEAPMAFLLIPYLDYDIVEFGLTAASKPQSPMGAAGQNNYHGTGEEMREGASWVAGGIIYTAQDFGAKAAEPWMEMIGKEIDGNEVTPALAQWLSVRSAHRKTQGGNLKAGDARANSGLSVESRSWTLTTPAPSPVVIDFINGEGLTFVKRYNGSLVVGRSPIPREKAGELKPTLQPPDTELKPAPILPRQEEFTIHVRTHNGNLYEVYPTRMASPEWQTYLEPHGNFTMSFFGRAELPWRFKDNKPASLVLVMYPKSLPANYEFRRAQLVRVGKSINTEAPEEAERAMRYGVGKVILYNFSGKPVAGRLRLPKDQGRIVSDTQGTDDLLILVPNERREISVSITVPWGRYEKIEAPISFLPEDPAIPAARFLTTFVPDVGGMKANVLADMLPQHRSTDSETWEGYSPRRKNGANYELIPKRVRAIEEEPMMERDGFFAQQGAKVEKTADGFLVKITGLPPGKPQRVEVEIPWPDALGFSENEFLRFEYRLTSLNESAN